MRGEDSLAQDWLADVLHINEVVGKRPDVELSVDPAGNLSPLPIDGVLGGRRQRRPADIFIACAPGNPGRPPFFARHPHPAVVRDTGPSSIMVGCPSKILIGNPGPAHVGVGPLAVGIRTPVAVANGDAWLPAIAITLHIDPISAL